MADWIPTLNEVRVLRSLDTFHPPSQWPEPGERDAFLTSQITAAVSEIRNAARDGGVPFQDSQLTADDASFLHEVALTLTARNLFLANRSEENSWKSRLEAAEGYLQRLRSGHGGLTESTTGDPDDRSAGVLLVLPAGSRDAF